MNASIAANMLRSRLIYEGRKSADERLLSFPHEINIVELDEGSIYTGKVTSEMTVEEIFNCISQNGHSVHAIYTTGMDAYPRTRFMVHKPSQKSRINEPINVREGVKHEYDVRRDSRSHGIKGIVLPIGIGTVANKSDIIDASIFSMCPAAWEFIDERIMALQDKFSSMGDKFFTLSPDELTEISCGESVENLNVLVSWCYLHPKTKVLIEEIYGVPPSMALKKEFLFEGVKITKEKKVYAKV